MHTEMRRTSSSLPLCRILVKRSRSAACMLLPRNQLPLYHCYCIAVMQIFYLLSFHPSPSLLLLPLTLLQLLSLRQQQPLLALNPRSKREAPQMGPCFPWGPPYYPSAGMSATGAPAGGPAGGASVGSGGAEAPSPPAGREFFG